MSAQYHREYDRSSLRQLLDCSLIIGAGLGDVRQDLGRFISLQKDIRRDELDTACRRDLRVVDPQHDMERIEKNKDDLLVDSYVWILRTDEYGAFTDWDNGNDGCSPCRVLWIKGHAGTGKTMLMMGLVRELSRQPAALAPTLSFFFCQGTDAVLNNATAILRSLIWLLLVQQPELILHLRQKYNEAGADLFKDRNAFYALSEAFRNMLKDTRLSPVNFVVDALDECDHAKSGLDELLSLIAESLTLTDKVRWLVSSRPEIAVHAKLGTPKVSKAVVELDSQRLEAPVHAYIDYKLSSLKGKDGYDNDTLARVSDVVRKRAINTFLWVALVFKELEQEDGYHAIQIIEEMPRGLSELYGHMMTRIETRHARDVAYCKKVLVAVSLAYRPLSLAELSALAGLPRTLDYTRAVVDKCGSFLTVKGGTVYQIHQSAKEYLVANYPLRLDQGGTPQGHVDMYQRSIDAMSTLLRRYMYKTQDFGVRPERSTPPAPDAMGPIRYSCTFWLDHLYDAVSQDARFKDEIADNGSVWNFLSHHFLHWTEGLSLLGGVAAGRVSIARVRKEVRFYNSRRY
jgi:hypothetical protein